jgi:transposase InsO family protein
MSGKHIKIQQVKIYMNARSKRHTQVVSAAKASISERSGRRIEKNRFQTNDKKARTWRTRVDPFQAVWSSELIPMLNQHPNLLPITLLEYLQEKYPEKYPDNQLRTLERRVKKYKALYGAQKEVIFRQTHLPGQLGLSDFTHPKIMITIRGKVLTHLLYHFRLVFSKWSYMKVILGGESYTALTEGLQEALWRLGGAPLTHRTDSLSAAFKNLSSHQRKDITQQYEAFCQHYQMRPTRNNPGKSHENGAIESPHGHLKRRIRQALLIRGSHDFKSLADYQAFIDNVVQTHNRRNATQIVIEKEVLQSLPDHTTQDFTELVVRVTSSSTICVRRVTYSVPSRFCGETLRIHLYDDRLCCYLGNTPVITLDRVRLNGKKRARCIDYRHVIDSLVKKPGAFRYSQIREDLLPNAQYQKIWHHIDQTYPGKTAAKLMVKLLYLASKTDEVALADTVLAQIHQNQPITLAQLETQHIKKPKVLPNIEVIQHPIHLYDTLLEEFHHA